MLSCRAGAVLAESEESFEELVMRGAEAGADYRRRQKGREMKVMTPLKWESTAKPEWRKRSMKPGFQSLGRLSICSREDERQSDPSVWITGQKKDDVILEQDGSSCWSVCSSRKG